MQKRHFEALAAALRAVKPGNNEAARLTPVAYLQWSRDVNAAANVLASFNPRFDRARFLQACGVE